MPRWELFLDGSNRRRLGERERRQRRRVRGVAFGTGQGYRIRKETRDI